MFRKQTTFPQYDSPVINGNSFQTTIGNDIEKRCNALVLKLPKWGNMGTSASVIMEYMNTLLGINFNLNHVRYPLEFLVRNEVIGKRILATKEVLYYARPSTKSRWAQVRIKNRVKNK